MRDRISRRNFLRTVGVGGLVLLNPPRLLSSQTRGGNVVLRWNDAFLQGVRESKLGPPMVSRALAVAHTCIFDAWAAYDRLALGTRVGGALRRPARERSLINKQTAISFAAYRAGADLFPASVATVFDPLMASLGFDPGTGRRMRRRRPESATSPPRRCSPSGTATARTSSATSPAAG